MSSENSTPDLASVMRILQGLTQAKDQQQAQSSTQSTSAPTPEIKSHGSATQPHQQWPQSVTPPVMHSQSSLSQIPNNTKIVDPATIVDWSAGLRCVMRTVGKHNHILQEIRKVSKYILCSAYLSSISLILITHK